MIICPKPKTLYYKIPSFCVNSFVFCNICNEFFIAQDGKVLKEIKLPRFPCSQSQLYSPMITGWIYYSEVIKIQPVRYVIICISAFILSVSLKLSKQELRNQYNIVNLFITDAQRETFQPSSLGHLLKVKPSFVKI